MKFLVAAVVLVAVLFATGVIGCNVTATVKDAAAASGPRVYWERPWAEHLLIAKRVAGVAPIIDARCTGIGKTSLTPVGVRRYSAFSCKALTNVGGRYPWVAVAITATGPSSFTARVA